jgi:hypothetical protein
MKIIEAAIVPNSEESVSVVTCIWFEIYQKIQLPFSRKVMGAGFILLSELCYL